MEKPFAEVNRGLASDENEIEHADCKITLITSSQIKDYSTELKQLLIDKGYKPSPVAEEDFVSQAKVGDLVLEYGVEISYEDKSCSEKVSLITLDSLNPFKEIIISTNELKRKTYLGKTIKCKQTRSLLSLTPKCNIR